MINYTILWHDLREKAFEESEDGQSVFWKNLSNLMERMEIEQGVYDATNIKLGEKEKNVAMDLIKFGNDNGGNCFDYIEYISKDEAKGVYKVGIFTEPLGIIGFEGEDLIELLRHIYQLYSSQPKTMSYIHAGHILFRLSEEMSHTLDFKEKITNIEDVWKRKL